jgi:hypothetical protein
MFSLLSKSHQEHQLHCRWFPVVSTVWSRRIPDSLIYAGFFLDPFEFSQPCCHITGRYVAFAGDTGSLIIYDPSFQYWGL